MADYLSAPGAGYASHAISAADAFIARGPHRLLIDGKWTAGRSAATFEVVDPATGRSIGACAAAGPADVDAAVQAARAAFIDPRWRNMDPHAREALLHRIADLLAENAEELAAIQSRDLGASVATSRVLVLGGIEAFRYYAGWPSKIFGRTLPSDGSALTYTTREPLGVVGAIIPWNGPAQAGAWKMAPALACGNTVVLKASSEAPLVSIRMLELLVEAGVPAGVVNLITGSGADAGGALVEHPGVDKITFTGSTEVGKTILVAAAKTLKKVTLELGGKSPTILFADADLERAIPAAVAGFSAGAGQGCVAGSRILVEASIHDRVVAEMVKRVEAMSAGSAFEDGSELPPIVSRRQLSRVTGYIDQGRREGARLVTGGHVIDRQGFFVEPTIFTDVTPSMTIAKEEIFGPVATVMPFASEREAITMANAAEYGLSASIWTNDVGRMHRMMGALEAGMVWGNTIFELDVKAPFGGYKQSGLGRELGPDSIEAFTQVKTGIMRFGVASAS